MPTTRLDSSNSEITIVLESVQTEGFCHPSTYLKEAQLALPWTRTRARFLSRHAVPRPCRAGLNLILQILRSISSNEESMSSEDGWRAASLRPPCTSKIGLGGYVPCRRLVCGILQQKRSTKRRSQFWKHGVATKVSPDCWRRQFRRTAQNAYLQALDRPDGRHPTV
ncbi:hypothetical protein SAMN05421753_12080 [Planctomicrobium piriforme]|uniref:Uncharacterized protein n=1 Tax=Planctomicrobium piriforme TaxID=1576369 RepID=A0A1I3RCH3_9PLAN|nr:hypothetical protein SAMN05421753_12080 [Planctomicrobium piriforme]